MQGYIIRRLLLFIPTMLVVTLVVFLFMRIIPGDPALLILTGHTGEGSYTQQDLDNLRAKLGTDKPFMNSTGDGYGACSMETWANPTFMA